MSLLLFIFSPASAESAELVVRGKVLEKETRKPLQGITVFLLEREEESVVTGKDGGFTLAVGTAGEFTLVASGRGYERSTPRKLIVTAETEELILFLMPVYAMTEVVVEADRNPDKTSKTVISGKELSRVAGSAGDPLRAIQALPGFTSRQDLSANFYLRGAGPGDVFFYADFLPVGYVGHLGGLSSVFNADLVENFNIYSSAFGPEFADVIGGVIDIKLRDPRQDELHSKLNISFFEADALIEGPVAPNQSFYLGVRRSYFDLLLDNPPEEDGVRITQYPRYYDCQGKHLWKLSEDHTLTLQMSGANDQMKSTLTSAATAVKKDPALEGDYSLYQSYGSLGVLLDSKLSSGVNNKFGISTMDAATETHMGQVGYITVNNDRVFLRDQLNVSAGERHDLLFGFDYDLSKINLDMDLLNSIPSEWTPGTYFTGAERVAISKMISVRSWGLTLKDRWRIAGPLTLVLGQRTAYESYFDKYKTEPRLFAEYTPFRHTLITAGWGKYHEFPQPYQIIEKVGNPELGYMQADHYVLGARQELLNGWSVRLEEYYKKLYNLVVPDATLNYVNAGTGKSYGTEVMITKNRTADWWGWITAGYSRSVRHNELTGETFSSPYDQPYIVNLVYNYKLSPKWTFGARWRYQSGGRFTPITGPDSTGRPVYGELWSEQLPDYHRLDLRMSAEVWHGMRKVEYYFDIINAYNRTNISGYDYNEDYTSRQPQEDWPFMPNIGLHMEF